MLSSSEQSQDEQVKEARDQCAAEHAHKLLSSVYGACLMGHIAPQNHHLNAGRLDGLG